MIDFIDFREIIKITLLIILILGILLYLYYRLVYSRRCVELPKTESDLSHIPGPHEWEKQMEDLSLSHHNVVRHKYSFVLADRNKLVQKKLDKIRTTISEIPPDIISLIPSARWLFDNYQIMYREIEKESMCDISYKKLSIMKSKQYWGYPRIYLVAKNMVSISRGHINEKNIAIMIHAYQKETPLTDEELGILPVVLGFCLLEQIVEVADDIIDIIKIKAKADKFVRGKISEHSSDADIFSLLCELEPDCKYNNSFHTHVIYLLRNMSFSKAAILKYTEYHYPIDNKYRQNINIFSDEGHLESSLESNIQVLVGSLRSINEIDDEHLFDELSFIESILAKDPAKVYLRMDSTSRAMYRSIIIKMSQKYKINEEIIAYKCLELANEGLKDIPNSTHVGYYLLGNGYRILKSKILNRKRPFKINNQKYGCRDKKGKCALYYLVLLAIVILFCFGMISLMKYAAHINDIYLYILFIIIGFPILIGISLEITNNIFTKYVQIRKIPSFDYVKGIPESSKTFLIMPVIVSSKSQCLDYVERLERHYLKNRQSNLYFALIIDYKDASEQHLPKDDILESVLVNQIDKLNKQYSPNKQKFALFIRDRKWNECEHCFMGWERKRGKIEEFNQLLCGCKKSETSFSKIMCDEQLLHSIKYVITLDADSDLVSDNAATLVGIIDHPLNKPIIDNETGKLKDGYVIIQPTVRNHIIDDRHSRFSKIFGDESGLSHYSFVISDIYQDIFNEGSYVGKGIYDVHAFNQLLHGTIPENRVLSHDLLESCYARTGFSSVVKILDNFPSTFISYEKREQRWIRGDWQLLPWLFKRNNFNNVSKWKIFDNLRRSLVSTASLLFLLLNLLLMPKLFYLGFILVFFSILSYYVRLLSKIIYVKIRKPRVTIIYKEVRKDIIKRTKKSILILFFIPYSAYIAMSAIFQTLYRMIISKKNLLKWNSFENVEKSVENTKRGYFYKMWFSLLPALLIIYFIYLVPISLVGIIAYVTLSLSWALSFLVAYYLRIPRKKKLSKADIYNRALLIETARRTWKFFKVFSFKKDNWLCPDNYQEVPQKKISNKTSPTNIGLQFLTILSARDFGFETLSESVNRVSNLYKTVMKLPKWKGHLYNWYNIRTLDVLNPSYVSTVDSGNFFGHLITLKNGLLEQIDSPILTLNQINELEVLIKKMDKNVQLTNKYTSIGELERELEIIKSEIISHTEDVRNRNESLTMVNQILSEIKDYSLQIYSFSNCATLRTASLSGNRNAKMLINTINEISLSIEKWLNEVCFDCLYNEKRKLFYIGYHVSTKTIDPICYDLIASEALLTSYLAISKGDVQGIHWNKLGRLLTMVKGIPCFISWSGTMFEYLMPKLVMKEYGGTVFENTSKAAVLQQINYAKKNGIPWGISESQYYRFDLDSNYQYKAFGVPKISLKPSFNDSLVITPYATFLAMSYAEKSAFDNLKNLIEKGAFGDYGFFESLDFETNNPSNLNKYMIIKSFMAHHQAMIIVSINNYLNNGIMRTRFHNEPIIKANESLIEEKLDSAFVLIPKRGYSITTKLEENKDSKEELSTNRYVYTSSPIKPVVNYLCNNRYSLLISSDGDGFSKYMNRFLYRWRADRYDFSGNYIYIKDIKTNKFWSATFNPTKVEPINYQATFSPNQAEFKRTDAHIYTHTSVSITNTHDLEIRKVSLSNRGSKDRVIQLTSYLEVVNDTYMAELSHPSFNKLFIESEFLKEDSIFLSKRRTQNMADKPYLIHLVKSGSEFINEIEYENDRLRFIGRNNTLQAPDALKRLSLNNSSGFSKDPIMSIRVSVLVKANEKVSVSFITGVCKDKKSAIQISGEYSDPYRIDNALEQFRRQSEMELKYLDISRAQLNAYQDLLSPIYYSNKYYRGSSDSIRKNLRNQSFLWKFGISGDFPILLLKVKSIDEISIIKDVLKAYEYYRLNFMKIDLIILDDSKSGYRGDLNDFLNDIISALKIYDESVEKKSLFIINTHQLIPAELDLLDTVASIVFTPETGIYFRNVKESLGEIIELSDGREH